MKRLRPRLFTVVSIFSLCLCVFSLLTWRKSYVAPTAMVPSTEPMRIALDRPMLPLRLQNAHGGGLSLEDSVEYFSYYTRGLRYEIDWPAMRAAGIEYVPVGGQFVPMTLGELLTKIIAPLGPKAEFTTDGRVIRISARNAPRSSKGIQYIPQPSLGDYVDLIARLAVVSKAPQRPRPLYERNFSTRLLTVTAARGDFRLWLTPTDPAAVYQPKLQAPSQHAILFNRFGSFLYRDRRFDMLIVGLPLWLITTLSSLLPVLWLIGACRRLGRRLKNFCPECGYDMRATPDFCPECGYQPRSRRHLSCLQRPQLANMDPRCPGPD